VHRVQSNHDTPRGVLTFQCPPPNQVQLVAIKKLRRSVVDQQTGGHGNPYTDVAMRQQYGDNVHVLGCIEALQDDTFLYIISPYCEYGSLRDVIPLRQYDAVHEELVYAFFVQLLQVLEYLKRHGICHGDLSLDSIMVYQGQLVVADLAMSFRPPQDGQAPALVRRLSPELLELLEGVLQEQPENRWNLARVHVCQWVRNYRQRQFATTATTRRSSSSVRER
jgi:hypothetical protein